MVKTFSKCTTTLAFLHCLIWQHWAPAIFSGNWPVSDKINSHEPVQTGFWLGPPHQEHHPKQDRLKFTSLQTYANITCQVRRAFIGHIQVAHRSPDRIYNTNVPINEIIRLFPRYHNCIVSYFLWTSKHFPSSICARRVRTDFQVYNLIPE